MKTPANKTPKQNDKQSNGGKPKTLTKGKTQNPQKRLKADEVSDTPAAPRRTGHNMAREYNSQQPADDSSPGEHNSNENVSENNDRDSDSVRSVKSDNSNQDHEEGEFHIHSSANEQDDGNDSSVTEIGSAERETETAQELNAADRKRRKD